MYRLAATTALTLAFTAPAMGEPLSATEFDALTLGKTIDYIREGMHVGTERYLSGRRVEWAFPGDVCQTGRWYETGGLICFVYDDIDIPQCWSFEVGPGGMTARFENDPENPEVYGTTVTPEPLQCLGPKVGV